MPLIPAGLSSFNEKVESARKGFNSSLDKAGQKSGVFKGPDNPKNASSSRPPPSISSRPPPTYSRPSNNPPPPPPTRNKLGAPPPPPPSRQASNPPPPPSRANLPLRRFDSQLPAQNQDAVDQESYEPAPPPPPPVAKRPTAAPDSTTPYRPPPTSINGYGPPSMAPVQPTSRYGPPSPPKSNSQLYDESVAIESENSQWPQQSYPEEPPPPITMKKPTNWQNTAPPQPQPNLSNPPRFLHQKHGQIPFPPFSQFTQQDKEAFFAMLDEFFGRKFPDRRPLQSSGQRDNAGTNNSSLPPQVSLQTRPSMAHLTPKQDQELCRAEEIARYFKSYRQWTSGSEQWYRTEDPVPKPMQGLQDVKRVSCWTQTGNERRQTNYVLFPDLSQLWSEVVFDVSRADPPRQASARFRPPPGQIDGHSLAQAADSYGPEIVRFAFDAEHSRQHVARGECWDLANEALKAFPAPHLQLSPPLTSISRTHGILLYHGRATGPGLGHGSWKQINDFGVIRPGDIIEWRLVACHTVNPSLSFTLGDPDHTAIIVEANGSTISSSRSAEDCPPTRLGLITVIEQSLKQIPIRRTYDLATISRGEVWIYRPMAEDLLLGPGSNQCSFPPPSPSFLPS
ncbi:hypothetical protein PGTUg99_019646 [Puccinia graminis f. sp. tritici]|uniref:BBC1/AIM3 cysteine proteinase-fold domain-containing protein n=1 Tax=Puccinia graminis f. sp. tritici TaxID=56615 RepID=A0A5B0RPM3_PUCGR|nr:hypothetical protein PGTUg99_019646 [Puccinia graminis f. sp. tritici]